MVLSFKWLKNWVFKKEKSANYLLPGINSISSVCCYSYGTKNLKTYREIGVDLLSARGKTHTDIEHRSLKL